MYDVIVKKVHVCYLIPWWVSCYFCDNFPNCKPLQIIFGRNIVLKNGTNWHMTILTFIRCVSLVYIITWRPFFLNSRT